MNPLEADTDRDGVLDGQETVKQQVRIDRIESYTLKEVNTLPSVEIVGQGDYSQKMYAVAIENNKTILEIDALVGTPFDFVHDEDMTFSSSKLTFSLSDEVLSENAIEDLAIAWYNYDENALELIETACDKDKNTISANVEHYSTYMVVSVPDYFFNIDYENTGNIITSGKADVVFVVDTTGSMGGTIRNVKNNINQFVEKLEENKVDIRLGLVEYRDIYADGVGSTKSYDWYTDVDSFKSQLSSLGVSGGGDTPESAVDALYCAKNMSFRTGVKKYIILISDADYKDGIASDSSITMKDAIDELVSKDIVTSVVTRTQYYTDYSLLVTKTDGVEANITENFVNALEPLILKMGEQVNKGCWVRLANGSVVCLDKDPTLEDSEADTDGDGIPDCEELKDSYKVQVYNPYTMKMQIIDTWSYYSDPSRKDTDGDGIEDGEDINPTQFDIVPVTVNESLLSFNTGRTWYINDYSAKEIWDAHKRLEEAKYDLNLNSGNEKQILEKAAEVINCNDLQSFSMEELIFVALMDGDGIRFYLDSKSVSQRESLFKIIYGRETDYYQQQGLINRSWEKVSGYEANGFFKGRVLSEADIVYSFDQLRIYDIYSVIDLVESVGIILVSSLIIVTIGYIVVINIQALSSYIQTYGVKNGVDFYLTLGVSNAPAVQNSLMKALSTEITDGDDDEYRLIDYVDDVIYTEDDVWALPAVKRGDYLDKVCGNNLVHNYPVIDKLENRVITSIKSIDTGLKSYQSAGGIYNKIVKDASVLYKFTGKRWAGIPIEPSMYDSKVLQIVLPNTTITAEQMLGLQAAELYVMNTYNIQIILTVATK